MENLLRSHAFDDKMVVFCAPTKPLVNQMAAETFARFGGVETKPGVSVVGVFTRDYRQNAENCKILITVR